MVLETVKKQSTKEAGPKEPYDAFWMFSVEHGINRNKLVVLPADH